MEINVFSTDIDVKWTLDARDNSTTRPKEQRAIFINSANSFTNTQTIIVRKKVECETSYAYVKDDIIDKLTPIKILLDFELSEEKLMARNKRELKPILDARVPTWTSFTAEIKNNCGDDKICFPDLALEIFRISQEKHTIGSTSSIEIAIILRNKGEDSFNTKVWITLPPGVAYDSISNQVSAAPISCGTLDTNSKMVLCDAGNPMKSKSESQFTLIARPTNTNDTKDVLVFSVQANSSNIEKNVEDYDTNFAQLRIGVTVVPDISIKGKSNPEFIVLNTTKGSSDEKTRLVKHSFQVRNQGNSAIKETKLQILWPEKDAKGNPVLTLQRPLIIEGNGRCNIYISTPVNASLFENLWWKERPVDYSSDNSDLREIDKNRGEKLDCSKTGDYCTVIQCVIGYLKPYNVFDLTVTSKIKPKSFLKSRKESEMYKLTSLATAQVFAVPYDFKTVDASTFPIVTREAVTVVHTDRLKPAGKGVKMWIIALAVTAGLLLLILLILLLWFCGFFKRKKHEEGYFMVNNGKSYIDNKILD